MERKYELLKDDTIEVDGRTLYRIRALRDFYNVDKGDLGGYIEKEENLSHDGNCWIYGDAKVYDNAEVFDDAEVCGHASVCDNAKIYGHASVCDNAKIYGDAIVCGAAIARNNVLVHDFATVCKNASVYGNAEAFGNAKLFGNAAVFGNAKVCNAIVCNYANVHGHAEIYGGRLRDRADISMDGFLDSKSNYCYIAEFGSENRETTFFMCKDGAIKVNCGCFSGTLDEFRHQVKGVHKDSAYAKEYLMAADLAELRLKREGDK